MPTHAVSQSTSSRRQRDLRKFKCEPDLQNTFSQEPDDEAAADKDAPALTIVTVGVVRARFFQAMSEEEDEDEEEEAASEQDEDKDKRRAH